MTCCMGTDEKFPCGQTMCNCYLTSSVGYVDCENRNLTRIPIFYTAEVMAMNTLNLERNHLRRVDKGSFNLSIFTSLTRIYLRYNPQLDCQSVEDNIPERIKVIADCSYTPLMPSSTPETATSTTAHRVPSPMAVRIHIILYSLLGLVIVVVIILLLLLGVYLKGKFTRSSLNTAGSDLQVYSYESPVYQESDV